MLSKTCFAYVLAVAIANERFDQHLARQLT